MKSERRVAERVEVDLTVHWEGEKGRHQGTINDLSIEGCFVIGSGEVTDGELVRVEIELPRTKIMVLWGEISNHLDEIGFGMRFTNTGPLEATRLKRLIESSREKDSPA